MVQSPITDPVRIDFAIDGRLCKSVIDENNNTVRNMDNVSTSILGVNQIAKGKQAYAMPIMLALPPHKEVDKHDSIKQEKANKRHCINWMV